MEKTPVQGKIEGKRRKEVDERGKGWQRMR